MNFGTFASRARLNRKVLRISIGPHPLILGAKITFVNYYSILGWWFPTQLAYRSSFGR
jgi:hypothetical protein